MFVLGINAYHAGASACLLDDGQLVAAAEEERFRRVKYWAGFPTQAIEYCLREAGITAYDLDHVGISRNPAANLRRKVLFALARRPSLALVRDRLANAARVRDPKAELVRALGLDAAALKARFHHVEHHRAHLASAFFVSPFEEAAVLSVDGMGDFVSTMWAIGRGNRLEVLGRVGFPHSLGILYTAICQWLGFTAYGDEGKVMGLAPYGQPTCLERLHRLVRLHRDGTFELDLDYFNHHAAGATMTWDDGEPTLGPLYSPRLVDLLGPPADPGWRFAEPPGSSTFRRYADVAASLQALLEEAEFALLRLLRAELDRSRAATGEQPGPPPAASPSNLCLAGGVALNSVFNGKIRPSGLFDGLFIQPAAGDAGTALGVAYYIYHHVLGRPRCYVQRQAGTGPAFDNSHIAGVLEAAGLAYQALDEAALCREAARLLDQGCVLGWFQGRMEWGPRALGHRSILADPRRADMRDILNARIKRREAFRPFAPSVLLEATGAYFDQDYPDPFMLKVYGVRPEQQPRLPAVTHVDGSGRLQTVDRQDEPLYWQLIHEFEQVAGVPVVLNTSFNENEPIVCRPEEAVDCFLRTRMDALAIGNYLVVKR